jgi:hypothetical protein
MKRYLKTYSYIFVIINILLLLLSAGIKFRFNIEVPFIRLCIAGFFISAFIALSWMIFTSRKGNIILKIILGFVALLPIVILLRRSFGPLLFRASFAIYIFSFIIAIIYAIAVLIVSAKTKKEERELNELIKDKK